ncbi:hypothetical protein GE09DRAFT_1152965 [Coniochaeta sp. 2T2.1]|nr:hypothetical protein GE09DRAFT_1152965 [Coniochaeta sp. 2T2.1]
MTTDFNKLTVMELRAELKKHGQVQTGKKAELVQRLQDVVENGTSEDANKEPVDEEQSDQPQDPREDTTTTPNPEPAAEPVVEDPSEPVSAPAESEADLPNSVDVTFPTNGNETAQPDPDPMNDSADAQPPTELVATTTISIDQQTGETMPPVTEVIKDVQSRKRRSRTPSIDESVRKRLRPDDPEPRQVDVEMPDESRQPVKEADDAEKVETVDTTKDTSDFKEEQNESKDDLDQPMAHQPDVVSPPRDGDLPQYDGNAGDDVVMKEEYDTRPEIDNHPRDSYQDYPPRKMEEDEPAEPYYGTDDRPVVPAIHPVTSALYIKNFMRPLRTADVKDHIIALATPPSKEFDPDVVVDFYLDPIRTHAFVSFNSISAASRVRSALHDQVWPDERNRKALWVDFVPAEKVVEWIDREEADNGGRGKMNRWEVIYEPDEDGIMTARLEEGGPDPAKPAPRPAAPPTGPASTLIPTGPSQPASGIQGAPTGPRGRGGRMPPGYPLQGGVTPQEGTKATRANPSLLYRPQGEELALRRIDNMRSYYTKDKHRDMGPVEDINRYTFEDVDRFVDRGKEVFVGIRPPHRERQMRGGGGGGGGPRGPRRGGPPPPPPMRPRGDRYLGGGRDASRDDFTPRSRFDGAPLPTYEGGRDRRGRNGFGGYGR